jgi:disulfide oxidoreductase YuzD
MSKSVLVQIIGAKIACAEGVKDSWREVAGWVAGQLRIHFSDEVSVQYFDLLDSTCPPLPSDAQLPLVLVNGEVLSSGGKISVSMIRKHLDLLRIESPG